MEIQSLEGSLLHYIPKCQGSSFQDEELHRIFLIVGRKEQPEK